VLVSIGLPVLAVVVGALVGWLAGDHSCRHWILSFGGSFELFGLLLAAAPELVPILRAVGRRVASAWRKAADFVRRVLRLPRHHRLVVSDSVSVEGAGSLSASLSIAPGASLDEKVEFLLRRYNETEDRLDEIAKTLRQHPDDWQAAIDAATASLRTEQAEAIRALRGEHLRERLLGVAMLLLGLVLATWGNLA
jgi:hypothetical protein